MRLASILLASLAVSGCDLLSGLAALEVVEPGQGGAAGGGGEGAGGGTPAGRVELSAVFGESGATRGLALAVNEDDEVLVAGTTNATVDLGGGALTPIDGTEILVGHLDGAGNHLRSVMLGGLGAQEVWSLAIAADEGVILGGTAENELVAGGEPVFSATAGFVVKLDRTALGVVWERHFDGEVVVASVAVAPEGTIYVGGSFVGAVSLPDGTATADGVDGFVSKLASDGSHLWTRRVGGPLSQRVSRLAATSDGGVVVGGEFEGTLDSGAGPVTADALDVLVAKLDGQNLLVWQQHLSGAGEERVRGLDVNEQGGVVVLGTYTGTVALGGEPWSADADDMFVAVLADGGELIWGRGLQGTDESQQLRRPVAFDSDGDIVFTGVMVQDADFGGGVLSPNNQSRDVVVAKLSSQGEHVFSHAWGGADTDLGAAVAVDSQRRTWVTGSFQTEIVFDKRYSVRSDRSMFLLLLGP